MDRYQGPEPMSEAEAHALELLHREREEWERDQAAIRKYESWYLAKTIAEADAEGIVR